MSQKPWDNAACRRLWIDRWQVTETLGHCIGLARDRPIGRQAALHSGTKSDRSAWSAAIMTIFYGGAGIPTLAASRTCHIAARCSAERQPATAPYMDGAIQTITITKHRPNPLASTFIQAMRELGVPHMSPIMPKSRWRIDHARQSLSGAALKRRPSPSCPGV